MTHKLKFCIASLLSVLLLSISTPASAADEHWGNYRSVYAPNKCLDARFDNMPQYGSVVQSYPCNGSFHQVFFYNAYTQHIKIGYPTNISCLDVDLNTAYRDGAKLQIWGCADALQQKFVQIPVAAGFVYRSLLDGRCIDFDTWTVRNRYEGKAQMWTCNWATQQQFWMPGW